MRIKKEWWYIITIIVLILLVIFIFNGNVGLGPSKEKSKVWSEENGFEKSLGLTLKNPSSQEAKSLFKVFFTNGDE